MKKIFSTMGPLISCFILTFVFSMLMVGLRSPNVQAETADNILAKLGSECGKVKAEFDGLNPTGKWGECLRYEALLADGITDFEIDGLGCSKQMFFQKTDENDKSAKVNEWYVNEAQYAACYQRAKSKLEELSSDKCKNLIKNSPNWKSCENMQGTLWIALGCDNKMFDPTGDDRYRISGAKLNNCEGRLGAVGNMTVLRADGSRSKGAKEIEPSQAGISDGPEGNSTVDCDATFSSPLSWIACPIIDMGVGMTDTVFQNIIKPMLENVPVTADPENGVYIAWQQFRLIANVLLVGSLLVIVYSQARGGK